MKARKRIRERGKPRLSRIFQELKPGEEVVLLSVPGKRDFPLRWHGKTAEVIGKQGRAYRVKFLNGKMLKEIVVSPACLKRKK